MTDVNQQTTLTQDLLHKLGKLVHQLQRERGCASLFIDSSGAVFDVPFNAQIDRSDQAVEALQHFCRRREIKQLLPAHFEGRLGFLGQKFAQLADDRRRIRHLSVRYTHALNRYTFSLIIPLIDTMVTLAQTQPENNSALVSAYANFLQWKERVGMERALGARGFYSSAFRNQEFRDRFVALIAEQKTYHDGFKALASPSQIALLQEGLTENDMAALATFNAQLENGTPCEDIALYSGEAWFNILIAIIEKLHKVEIQLVNGLTGANDRQVGTASGPMNARNQLPQYKGFVKLLPSFAKLDDHDLDDLLSFAEVKKYPKDKLLFLRDEPAARLYIVLNGWVKTFNGRETGEEAILQMIGSGEMLLEAEVLLGVAATASAQVVENALLLSIPAPIIRQRVQSNSKLALNMLNVISLRSQRLIQQLELSRLKSAKERVGWFLLRLAINQKPADGVIFLPYEKSIIASYLDMRPETFSRTLQKFKSEGFEISNDRVTLPATAALCDFCDLELAGQCGHANSANCQRTDLEALFLSPTG